MKVISYLLLIDEGFIEVVPEGTRTVHRATPKGMSAIEQFERSNGEMDMHILAPNSLQR
jgi:predicted transcriptional regulator